MFNMKLVQSQPLDLDDWRPIQLKHWRPKFSIGQCTDLDTNTVPRIERYRQWIAASCPLGFARLFDGSFHVTSGLLHFSQRGRVFSHVAACPSALVTVLQCG